MARHFFCLPPPMPDAASKAVFLSYASQDAEAARRIADALRAVGVEVWFDQNELVGGDAWDQKIRGQVASCALFVPVVSAATQARREGYFRLEWKLADERTHLMAEGTPFILPVTIDGTTERGALVPKSFVAVQWTKLGGGETTVGFVERVKKLLGGSEMETGRPRPVLRGEGAAPPAKVSRRVAAATLMTAVVVVAVAAALFFSRKPPNSDTGMRVPSAEKSAPSANAKAVAVLPFENLSAEPDGAFLAEGIHGEVITAVGKISALTVIGRTSVLPYADVKKRNLRQIADDLGVGSVVEGRVQRVGKQVRITVELVDAQSGRQLWGNQFDFELNDVFAVQASIAREVASTLKATLTASEQKLIDRRLTNNPVAYELFLRARLLEETNNSRSSLEQYERAAAAYQSVLAEDSSFGIAHARLTYLHGTMFWLGQLDPTPARRALAEAAMQAAVRLEPTAPETQYARGLFAYYCEYDWARALSLYRQAELGLPNDAALAGQIGYAHRRLGNWPEAVQAFERAVALNPRNLYDGGEMATTLLQMRRFELARRLSARFAAMFPDDNMVRDNLARAEFALSGDRGAYLDALAKLPRAGRDPSGRQAEYEQALWAHDFTRAELALADPQLTGIVDRHDVIKEPISLHRGLVAFLLGKHEAARRFADEAIAEYGRQNWTARQRYMVMLGVATAKGLAGRTDEAVGELQAASAAALKFDAFGGNFVRSEAGRILAALGRRDEALAMLRETMQGLSRFSPNEIRLDPLWSRLKDDPRFEEILKSEKPL